MPALRAPSRAIPQYRPTPEIERGCSPADVKGRLAPLPPGALALRSAPDEQCLERAWQQQQQQQREGGARGGDEGGAKKDAVDNARRAVDEAEACIVRIAQTTESEIAEEASRAERLRRSIEPEIIAAEKARAAESSKAEQRKRERERERAAAGGKRKREEGTA